IRAGEPSETGVRRHLPNSPLVSDAEGAPAAGSLPFIVPHAGDGPAYIGVGRLDARTPGRLVYSAAERSCSRSFDAGAESRSTAIDDTVNGTMPLVHTRTSIAGGCDDLATRNTRS